MSAKFPEKLEFLFQPSRYKIAHGGRGSGKSWGFARALLIQAAQQPLRILCTREIQNTIADSVHKLLGDQIKALGLEEHYDVQERVIRGRNGSEIVFAGLRQTDSNKLKSFEGVDRCWVEEGQAVTKKSWDVLTPTIRKEGSEIWVTYNPDLYTDDTHQRFVVHKPADAVVVQMNWRDNPWFSAVLESERQSTLQRDPEGYANIWEGEPRSAVAGAIFYKEITKAEADGRIRPVPYDPLLKVHAVWDLGWNDSMSIILVQRGISELRVIDFLEDSHRTLDSYVADLRDKRYNWGRDFIPHDGRAKDFKSGKSAEEMLRKFQRRPTIVPDIGVEQGIKAARLMFSRCYFDEKKAAGLIEHLRRYSRVVSQVTDEPGAPKHDEHSHSADAFRYAAVAESQMKNEDSGGDIKYPSLGLP